MKQQYIYLQFLRDCRSVNCK